MSSTTEGDVRGLGMLSKCATSVKEFLRPTPPVCEDCGDPMGIAFGDWLCCHCVACKILDEREADAAWEAHQMSAAVLASPEYQALLDRVAVLEIAVGKTYEGPAHNE